MTSNFKTLFIPTTQAKARPMFKNYEFYVNGDELARNVQAAIQEMEENGFELISQSAINSAQHNYRYYTTGVLMVFKKTTSSNDSI